MNELRIDVCLCTVLATADPPADAYTWMWFEPVLDGRAIVEYDAWTTTSPCDLVLTLSEDSEVYLFTCTCGVPGCAGIVRGVPVWRDSDGVHWNLSDAPGMVASELSEPVVFEPIAYDAAIRDAIATAKGYFTNQEALGLHIDNEGQAGTRWDEFFGLVPPRYEPWHGMPLAEYRLRYPAPWSSVPVERDRSGDWIELAGKSAIVFALQDGTREPPQLVVENCAADKIAVRYSPPESLLEARAPLGRVLLVSTEDEPGAETVWSEREPNVLLCRGIHPQGPPCPNVVLLTTLASDYNVEVVYEPGYHVVGGPYETLLNAFGDELYERGINYGAYTPAAEAEPSHAAAGYDVTVKNTTIVRFPARAGGTVTLPPMPNANMVPVGNPFPMPASLIGGYSARTFDPALGEHWYPLSDDATRDIDLYHRRFLLRPGQGIYLCPNNKVVTISPAIPPLPIPNEEQTP